MANKPINEYFSGLPKNSSPSSATNLVVEENGAAKKVPIGSLPSGGGSGGASIIYATEKPSTPQQAIYVITEDEAVKAESYAPSSEEFAKMLSVEMVDVLPEVGVAAADVVTTTFYVYYLTADGDVYGYVDEYLSAVGGGQIPVGWYPAALLFSMVGVSYGGVITSTDQATDYEALYVLATIQPKTRVYVPMQDGAFLELTSGIRTRFDKKSETVYITEV